jgi:hypothetical protein
MEKVGRNDPCPCGSGKKFKKCCESKAAAQKTITSAQVLQGTSKMASLFQRNVKPLTPQNPPSETPPEEDHLNM